MSTIREAAVGAARASGVVLFSRTRVLETHVHARGRRALSGRTGSTVDNVLDRFVLRSIGPFRGGRVVAVAGDPL
ncbi:MAG: hypothetical protein EXR61_06000, partial [Chloroflexi bacterium]|nr:hypothetical protein [Chloroflexota bacterium]